MWEWVSERRWDARSLPFLGSCRHLLAMPGLWAVRKYTFLTPGTLSFTRRYSLGPHCVTGVMFGAGETAMSNTDETPCLGHLRPGGKNKQTRPPHKTESVPAGSASRNKSELARRAQEGAVSDGMVPQGLRDRTSARSLEGEEESRVDFRTGALRPPPLRLRNTGPWDRAEGCGAGGGRSCRSREAIAEALTPRREVRRRVPSRGPAQPSLRFKPISLGTVLEMDRGRISIGRGRP